MNIVHLVSTYPPYHGGMGRVAAQLSKSIAHQQQTVTVITATPGQASEETIDGVRVIRLTPRWRVGNAALMRSIVTWLQGYDVVHLHWPWIGGFEDLYRAIARERLRNSKGVPSTIIMQYHMDLVGQSALQRAAFWYENAHILPRLLKRCHAVVCSSEDYRSTSTILSPLTQTTPPLVASIPLGVDSVWFSPSPGDEVVARRWGVEPDTSVIGFVGALDQAHYFKGVEVLLSALPMVVERLPHLKFRLIIVGAGNLLPRFEQIVRDSGLNALVQFTGSVDDGELVELYRIMDCVVLPSTTRSEAFGLTLLEAMACGRAVVASNIPGVRTLIEVGYNGAVSAAGDYDDLARTLAELFQDPANIQQMGENSRKRVLLQYQWDVIARQWIDLYKRLDSLPRL